jgi:hypothetical protein
MEADEFGNRSRWPGLGQSGHSLAKGQTAALAPNPDTQILRASLAAPLQLER